ncbi:MULTISPECIES: GNAT family N-acetyltransferase [unclassified Rhizobium]|uniref:GNAT family N-acetyltransferase n=1 Tax=unclassified Rhizobium TaxID=2613769 RepID=UPI0006F53D52|nr:MULTISPECIES: GNAT family N-acetyltransferase [unclassified Rhizobium]KQV34406.1 acetyltransferase [Rhizobium sp. Root1212]KRD23784.1 acetyltransferase [Rhizobium sp. Root268]
MITIRIAREDDVIPLTAIGLSAWQTAVLGLVDPVKMRHTVEVAFLSFLRNNWERVLVGEIDGALAGWVASEQGDGTITDLWVAAEVQRQGLGSALLEQMENRIAAMDIETAELGTHARNTAAVDFFMKRGYSVSSLSTSYAAKLDQNVETIGLRKVLIERPELDAGSSLFSYS